jgi:hypothetical protein
LQADRLAALVFLQTGKSGKSTFRNKPRRRARLRAGLIHAAARPRAPEVPGPIDLGIVGSRARGGFGGRQERRRAEPQRLRLEPSARLGVNRPENRLSDDSASKATLPFVEEQLEAARALMGEDFWPYGLAPNRETLARFLKAHHRQGLSARPLAPEDLFHPSSLETHRI